MIEIGSWIGLAAMTRSERLPSKMSVGIIWVLSKYFRKIGITLERRVMIFISGA
jgi:hypothetical protein